MRTAYADRLLQLADEAQAAVAGARKPAGLLRIGSMETAAAARLPAVLAAFHGAYPEVDLQLETAPTDPLVQSVLNHKLDVALVAAPIERDELVQQVVFDEELVLLTGHGHAPVASPHDVARRVLLAFRTGCAYRRRLETWFAESGVPLARISEFGTFEAIIGCVAAGMGVAVMPREIMQLRDYRGTVDLHPLPPHIACVQTLLVWRADVLHHPARTAFAASFKARTPAKRC
jgi:DNA-binding transcriptional LysR family regulator